MSQLYKEHFGENDYNSKEAEAYLQATAYTLAERRSSLPWKSFSIVKSISKLSDAEPNFSRPVRASKNIGNAFIFIRQGAQYAGMGRELLAYPTFKGSLGKCEIYLHELGCKWSIIGA